MEFRGVRYTIRTGIERDSWSVAVHPDGVESAAKRVHGTRENAEFHARAMINRWLQKPRHTAQAVKPNMTAPDAEQRYLDQ
jgi:hypothetical protein